MVSRTAGEYEYHLITVGITVFNAETTIERAIRSALIQDWPNIEIVVVDDCSSDRSRDIAAAVLANHPKSRLLTTPVNSGVGASRNLILSNASGSFVTFFDDDDESHPHRVRRQYETLMAYEQDTGNHLIACYCSGRRIYPNGYQYRIRSIGSSPVVPFGNLVADYLLFNRRQRDVCYGAGVPTCAMFARKEVLLSIGGFDPNFRRVEDVELAVRLARAGGSFIGCAEELYTQYASEGDDKSPLRNLQAELQLVEKHADYLTQRGQYDYARAWFEIRFLHFSGQRMKFVGALLKLFSRHPLQVLTHLYRSGPARFRHERSILRNQRGKL